MAHPDDPNDENKRVDAEAKADFVVHIGDGDQVVFLEAKRRISMAYATQIIEGGKADGMGEVEHMTPKHIVEALKGVTVRYVDENGIVVSEQSVGPAPALAAPRDLPPSLPSKVLALLCNPDMLEAMLGDLDEKYEIMTDRFGPSFARRWYWWQACRSVGNLVVGWARRAAKLEALWRLIS